MTKTPEDVGVTYWQPLPAPPKEEVNDQNT